MRNVLIIAVLLFTGFTCKSPISITANPDDHTTTTGTAANAKMTNELPDKAKRIPVEKDSAGVIIDSLQKSRDSL